MTRLLGRAAVSSMCLALGICSASLSAESSAEPVEPHSDESETQVTGGTRAVTPEEVIGPWHWDIDRMLEVASETSVVPASPEMDAIMREAMTESFGKTQLTISADQLEMSVNGNVIELRNYVWLPSEDPTRSLLRSKHPDQPDGHRSERTLQIQRVDDWLVITDPRALQSMWLRSGPPPGLE